MTTHELLVLLEGIDHAGGGECKILVNDLGDNANTVLLSPRIIRGLTIDVLTDTVWLVVQKPEEK